MLRFPVSASSWVLARLGNPTVALNRLREGERLLQGLPTLPISGHIYYFWGCACLLLDKLDEFSIWLVYASARKKSFVSATSPHFPTGSMPIVAKANYRHASLVAHCHLGLGKRV